MTVNLTKADLHCDANCPTNEDGVSDCDFVYEATHQGQFRAELAVLRTFGSDRVELNRGPGHPLVQIEFDPERIVYGMHGVGPIYGPEDEPSLADFR